MTNVTTYNQWQSNLNSLFHLFIPVTLVYFIQENSLAIALMVILWMLSNKFRFQWDGPTKIATFLGGIYLAHLLWALGSESGEPWETVVHDWETKASLLIFPLAMASFKLLSARQVRNILLAFVIAVVIATVYSLVGALVVQQTTGDSTHFFYHKLGGFVNLHAIYFSMYVCMAIFILLDWIFSNYKRHEGSWKQILMIATAYYLFSFNILLSARTPTLALSLIVFAGIIKAFYERRKLWLGLGIIGVVIVMLVGGILLSPVNRERYKEAINYNSEYSKAWDGRNLRLMKWECAQEILLDGKWLWGVGTGYVQLTLQQCYEEHEFTPLTINNNRYNAHNQYLQTWLGLGIIGLLWFVGILGFSIYYGYKNDNLLHIAMVVMFAIVSLTESTLCVHKGVVFFSYFNCLMFFAPKSERV